jgi:gliding motility-associated lipoprotein GldH
LKFWKPKATEYDVSSGLLDKLVNELFSSEISSSLSFFNNLFLIVEMEYPHGKTIKDTLEYQMAEPNGALLGEGFTDIKENKLWYKGYGKPFIFEEKGDYNIKIQHAMRNNGDINGVDRLEGITDVGFRIEGTNK